MTYNMSIACDHEGWEGTFALTAAFVVKDVLSDGAPVEVEIDVADPSSGHVTTISGQLTAYAPGVDVATGVTHQSPYPAIVVNGDAHDLDTIHRLSF